jgi:hypothetical protein
MLVMGFGVVLSHPFHDGAVKWMGHTDWFGD